MAWIPFSVRVAVLPRPSVGSASRSAGAPKNPAWYYNLAANPDKATIELAGRRIPVTAEQLHGSEREEAWQHITTAAPRFAQYQVKTDREIPVIRLTRRSAPEARDDVEATAS